MMCQIGDELHEMTSALPSTPSFTTKPAILGLCMVPGGFTAYCYARVCGISLPVSRGGHEMILPNWRSDPRIRVRFLDIIMLAAEMDVTNIPVEHPDATNFVFDRPFMGKLLIWSSATARAEHREKREAWRLLASQLVLALQCVKQDGKIVILLHKLEAWDTVLLPYTLGKFSSFQLVQG
ncbi:hypothetical protein J3E72DRAFT_326128 [Bipolaris maydis]|nr:hypothetical protein J3E72DRAFT_326128 [Bipolaris maydis]